MQGGLRKTRPAGRQPDCRGLGAKMNWALLTWFTNDEQW